MSRVNEMNKISNPMLLTELPDIVLEQIFSYLSYESVSINRRVCSKFNDVAWTILNRGFFTVEKFQAKAYKKVKAQLPRRESERRAHPLARQSDVLTAIETRLSMLSMTYLKWIEAKVCCFIPGKVIDELFKILRIVADNPNPPRSIEILQEFRDISSMAMEHFDEKILPDFKLPIQKYLEDPGKKFLFREQILHSQSGGPVLLKINVPSRVESINENISKKYVPSRASSTIENILKRPFKRLRDATIPNMNKRIKTIEEPMSSIDADLELYNSESLNRMIDSLFPDQIPEPTVLNNKIKNGNKDSNEESTRYVTIVEYNKLVVEAVINRRKLKAQAAEINELRQRISSWESKLTDFATSLSKTSEDTRHQFNHSVTNDTNMES